MAKERYEGTIGGLYRRNETFLVMSAVTFLSSLLIGYALAGLLEQIMGVALSTMKRQISQGELKLTTLSIFMNNFKVALILYGGGVIFGVVTAFFLIFNGLFIGYAASQFPIGDFLVYTIPHGIFEVTGIILAGAAGFRLGNGILDIVKGLRHVQSEISLKNQLLYLWDVHVDEFKDSLLLFGIAIILILIGAVIEANFTVAWGNYIKGINTV
ncbi:MAG TPA: stage II sporulation protein M [Methanobacteriaceae archaeon]|nr:stage II sporulation protein M [Methanobacteriaceae archaeon]